MSRIGLFSGDICLQLLEDVVVNDQSRYCYNCWWIMISVKLQIGMQYLFMIMIIAELVLLQLMVDCWWLLIAGSSV